HRLRFTRTTAKVSFPTRRPIRARIRKRETVTLGLSVPGFESHYPGFSDLAIQERKQGPPVTVASNHQPHVILGAVAIEIGAHVIGDRNFRPKLLPTPT